MEHVSSFTTNPNPVPLLILLRATIDFDSDLRVLVTPNLENSIKAFWCHTGLW